MTTQKRRLWLIFCLLAPFAHWAKYVIISQSSFVRIERRESEKNEIVLITVLSVKVKTWKLYSCGWQCNDFIFVWLTETATPPKFMHTTSRASARGCSILYISFNWFAPKHSAQIQNQNVSIFRRLNLRSSFAHWTKIDISTIWKLFVLLWVLNIRHCDLTLHLFCMCALKRLYERPFTTSFSPNNRAKIVLSCTW